MYPGKSELTLIARGPNLHAILRAICMTALFDVLYATAGMPCLLCQSRGPQSYGAYLVRNAPTHGCNQDDAPGWLEPFHLSSDRLCRIQHPIGIDVHDLKTCKHEHASTCSERDPTF